MPRHAAISRTGPHRSPSAERAHRAGDVTWTVDLSRSPAFEVRQRLAAAAARNAAALTIVAAGVWIYDIARLAGS